MKRSIDPTKRKNPAVRKKGIEPARAPERPKPGPQNIQETPDNLRNREEWFRKRSL
jgi:hypothetical protein